jgi:hypothetical protein
MSRFKLNFEPVLVTVTPVPANDHLRTDKRLNEETIFLKAFSASGGTLGSQMGPCTGTGALRRF